MAPGSTNEKAVSKDGLWSLFDNLNDPACSRFNQNCLAIYDRVAIVACTIFVWDVVVRDAVFRKNDANGEVSRY